MPHRASWFLGLLLLSLVASCSGPSGPSGEDDVGTIIIETDAGASDVGVSESEDATSVEDAAPDVEIDVAPEPVFEVDLRVDTNRNGIIDAEDPTEDELEDAWGPQQGAIFLANLDDDARRCPVDETISDLDLAGCHDAADEEINGESDLEDMAPLRILPTLDVPEDASATIVVEPTQRVRLFIQRDGEWQVLGEEAMLSADELRTGVDLRIEGRDVIRSVSSWNGLVDVEVTVSSEAFAQMPEAIVSDRVQLRVAPLVLRHHLDPVQTVFITAQGLEDGTFSTDVEMAAQSAGVQDVQQWETGDQWTQDFFETAYMMMPGPNGPHQIDVYIRSANVEYDFRGTPMLRYAGRIVYYLRGPDVAAVTAVNPRHNPYWDTLNSFGNTETIPPHSANGRDYPLGRIIRGRAGNELGDDRMVGMLEAQGVQPLVFVDTSWLLVAHVDETISFVEADTPRGWALVLNDAVGAVTLLEQARDAGHGQAVMFQNKNWINFNNGADYSAEITIDAVLEDPDIMASTAEAAIEVDEQLAILRDAIGVSDEEIIHLPFLHTPTGDGSVAYQPGVVNGLVMGRLFAAPRPHGPLIEGVDIVAAAVEQAFEAFGVEVFWVEDWDLYHRLYGEVHCGTNVLRSPDPDAKWWTAVEPESSAETE